MLTYPAPAPGVLQSQVRFNMIGASAQGRTLTISLQALNDGADRPVAISRDAVQIVDDAGNVYRATRVIIGNQEERSELINGIRTNVSLIFEGVQANAVARLRARVRVGPQVLGAKISPESSITWGIPIGVGLIVSAFVLTGIYVRRANGEFDDLNNAILKEAQQ